MPIRNCNTCSHRVVALYTDAADRRNAHSSTEPGVEVKGSCCEESQRIRTQSGVNCRDNPRKETLQTMPAFLKVEERWSGREPHADEVSFLYSTDFAPRVQLSVTEIALFKSTPTSLHTRNQSSVTNLKEDECSFVCCHGRRQGKLSCVECEQGRFRTATFSRPESG